MKIRLTESQYNNLLKTIKPNKKLTITESQYKRLILESTDQFTGIEVGNGIKIIAGNKPYTFKVFAVRNDELLVRNVAPNKDGRYETQYFLIKPGNLKNNSLTTQKSKPILYDYDDINKLLAKEKDANWKAFTFKNITSFEVYKDDKFKMLIEPKLDVKTGERVTPESKHENDSNVFKDNLIRGMEANHMYQLTFYDDSTVKFSVKQKKDSILDIEFETVSEKTSMSSDELKMRNKDNAKVWTDWLKKQKTLIAKLKKDIKNTDDPAEKDKLVKQLNKAEDDKEKNSKNINREEGLKSVSRIIYKGGVATKWMEALIDSAEFKYKTGLKIDLNNTIVNKQKIKTLNKDNDAEIARLKQELASATTEEDKKKIQKELNNIDKTLTLHFFNDKFDVYDNVAEGLRTFDLIVTLSYRPEEITKDLENGMEWDLKPKSEIYTKNFPLKGIKSLTIVKDKVIPLLTNKPDSFNMNKGEEFDLSRQKMDYKEIKDYILKSNADKTILNMPSGFMRLMGFKAKGMLPLEALQAELGNRLTTKDTRDKFIAGHLVLFEPDFNNVKDVKNQNQLNVFEKLVRGSSAKALVKRYSIGDNHVALNMKHEESGIMYTLFIQTKDESVDEKLKENEYYVELKYNYINQKKQPIAKFKIKVIDYKATKLN